MIKILPKSSVPKTKEFHPNKPKTELNKVKEAFPTSVSIDKRLDCLERFQEAASLVHFERCTCGVCGRLRFCNDCSVLQVSSLSSRLSMFIFRLTTLANLALIYTDDKIVVCHDCKHGLNHKSININFMSYGFYRIPSRVLPCLTQGESCLVALQRTYCKMMVFKHYGHGIKTSAFRGNAVTFIQNMNEICEVLHLPLSKLQDIIQVVYAGTGEGPFHYLSYAVQIRVSVVYAWLYWLKENNRLYQDVKITRQEDYDISQLDKETGVPLNIVTQKPLEQIESTFRSTIDDPQVSLYDFEQNESDIIDHPNFYSYVQQISLEIMTKKKYFENLEIKSILSIFLEVRKWVVNGMINFILSVHFHIIFHMVMVVRKVYA